MNNTYYSSDQPHGIRARINSTVNSFSLSGKLVFYILALIFIGSTLSLLWRVNSYFMVEIPARGGKITEGVLGLPRYINPVLAITDGDKDITALVYSGLMRETPEGSLIPDLAQSYTVSPDGKTYTFVLKSNIVFHDNTPVTADDVVYTVSQIQNPNIKSPKRANWNGVVAEKIDNRTVRFTLNEAYAPFLENTTIGILPRRIWSSISAEAFPLNDHNINPVGTGPYKVKSVRKNSAGVPVAYTLEANKKFVLGSPMITTVAFNFYPTEKALEEAYRGHEVDNINSISPDTAANLAKHGATIYTAPLPRIFGVFFNQTTNDALADREVRRALDMSVNREYIIDTVLQGFGKTLSGPMPQSFLGNSSSTITATTAGTSTPDERIAEANVILDKAGWKLNADGIRVKKTSKGTTTLSFSISTSDAPELKDVAEIVRQQWLKVGADVTVKVFEGGYLNQNIIRPRKYDALLFGQIVNKDFDLYAFWHSSQRTDPGLNIALYNNPKADKYLENMRTLSDNKARQSQYLQFASVMASDIPAVFLYSPDLIYAVSNTIDNITVSNITIPSDRFTGIYNWYIHTDRVWQAFARRN